MVHTAKPAIAAGIERSIPFATGSVPFASEGPELVEEGAGLAIMSQGNESLQHDSMLPTIVQKFPFQEIRMGFDMNNRRLDGRDFK